MKPIFIVTQRKDNRPTDVLQKKTLPDRLPKNNAYINLKARKSGFNIPYKLEYNNRQRLIVFTKKSLKANVAENNTLLKPN